jgi:hypothetical protein
MMDLSDLVLVFFDARHPEPGAMRDTLKHLVKDTIHRADSGKFLYILNQLDTAANEDNPEDVVAAWQRAMGEAGLTSGSLLHHLQPGRRQHHCGRDEAQALRKETRSGFRRDLSAHGARRDRARLPHRRRAAGDRNRFRA